LLFQAYFSRVIGVNVKNQWFNCSYDLFGIEVSSAAFLLELTKGLLCDKPGT
jgi:hypothetical protein